MKVNGKQRNIPPRMQTFAFGKPKVGKCPSYFYSIICNNLTRGLKNKSVKRQNPHVDEGK